MLFSYGEVYYVTPSADNNNNICPIDKECHRLSYYIYNFTFSDNMTLIFFEGQHLLDDKLVLSSLYNVTLLGQGQWIEGFHQLVMQSTVIIMCNNVKDFAILINQTKHVIIREITITNCEKSLSISFAHNISLFRISIQNNSRTGVMIDESRQINIIDSCFSKNGFNDTFEQYPRGHMSINNYQYPLTINIMQSNFSFAISADTGGLSVSVFLYKCKSATCCRVMPSNQRSHIELTDVQFYSNFGEESGGAYILLRGAVNSTLLLKRCSFVNNTSYYGGTALQIELCLSQAILEDVIIQSEAYKWINRAGTYTMNVICTNPFQQYGVLLSNVHILNSNKTGLGVHKCVVGFVNKSSVIANNFSPQNGGGIDADDQSAFFSNNATLHLINNTAGHYGGAMFSRAKLQLKYLHYHCTFYSLQATFFNNRAGISGDNIYGGSYYQCPIINKFDSTPVAWNFLPIINCTTEGMSSDPIGVCFCQDNNTVDCYRRKIEKHLYPGQLITQSLTTVGRCGGISPGVLVLTSNNMAVIPHDTDERTVVTCKEFSYTMKQTKARNGKLKISTTSEIVMHDGYFVMTIIFLNCPLGLQLNNISGDCVCNNVINNTNQQCSAAWMPHPIHRSGNYWFSYNYQYNCTIAHENCPFDYCNVSLVSLSLDESDLQCNLNRSGILCGQCQSGLSLMLGSNQCTTCTNNYLSLIIVFMAAGIILIMFLLVTNLTVSMGTVNGLLFYSNIVKLNEAVLFPNGGTPVLTQFIAWLNLDLGIQTCLFDGLDGYWKTWLQFVFPAYIWLLIVVVIISCHYSGRISRLCGNNAVPVLATLILMSFTKLLRTITNAIMVSVLKCGNRQWYVWNVDGNINYLSNKHIPLFLVSVFFLVVGLIYTGLVFSSQWLQRFSGKYCNDIVVKLKPFIDAYSGPYKDKYRFWTGLLLIVRFILSTIFSYTTGTIPEVNNYIIVIIVLLLGIAVKGIYRDNRVTRLELFHLLNLGIMCQLNALFLNGEWEIVALYTTKVSVIISMAVFFSTVCIHGYVVISQKYKCKLCFKKRQLLREEENLLKNDNSENDSVEMYSPARIVQRRESLIFDFDI